MAQTVLEPQSTPAVQTTPAAPADMDALAALYSIPKPEEISIYLAAHPLLLPVLLAAPAHIARVFGPDISARLVVEHDPEWIGHQYLWVDILTPMPTEADEIAADKLLYRLHDEWLIHLPRIETRDVNFGLEVA